MFRLFMIVKLSHVFYVTTSSSQTFISICLVSIESIQEEQTILEEAEAKDPMPTTVMHQIIRGIKAQEVQVEGLVVLGVELHASDVEKQVIMRMHVPTSVEFAIHNTSRDSSFCAVV